MVVAFRSIVSLSLFGLIVSLTAVGAQTTSGPLPEPKGPQLGFKEKVICSRTLSNIGKLTSGTKGLSFEFVASFQPQLERLTATVLQPGASVDQFAKALNSLAVDLSILEGGPSHLARHFAELAESREISADYLSEVEQVVRSFSSSVSREETEAFKTQYNRVFRSLLAAQAREKKPLFRLSSQSAGFQTYLEARYQMLKEAGLQIELADLVFEELLAREVSLDFRMGDTERELRMLLVKIDPDAQEIALQRDTFAPVKERLQSAFELGQMSEAQEKEWRILLARLDRIVAEGVHHESMLMGSTRNHRGEAYKAIAAEADLFDASNEFNRVTAISHQLEMGLQTLNELPLAKAVAEQYFQNASRLLNGLLPKYQEAALLLLRLENPLAIRALTRKLLKVKDQLDHLVNEIWDAQDFGWNHPEGFVALRDKVKTITKSDSSQVAQLLRRVAYEGDLRQVTEVTALFHRYFKQGFDLSALPDSVIAEASNTVEALEFARVLGDWQLKMKAVPLFEIQNRVQLAARPFLQPESLDSAEEVESALLGLRAAITGLETELANVGDMSHPEPKVRFVRAKRWAELKEAVYSVKDVLLELQNRAAGSPYENLIRRELGLLKAQNRQDIKNADDDLRLVLLSGAKTIQEFFERDQLIRQIERSGTRLNNLERPLRVQLQRLRSDHPGLIDVLQSYLKPPSAP
jgi:hypothetical protein